MKKIFLLITLAALTISCGGDSKSIESIIEGENLSEIRKKRDELVLEQTDINVNLKLIDDAISRLDTLQNYPLVTSFQVKQNNFNHFLELQGNVETKKNIILYPEFSGLLTKLNVEEGQKVSKGKVLGTIDDGGLSQQLSQMEVQFNLAKTTFERQKRLWEQKIGSEMEFLQAKANYEGMQNSVDQMRSQVAKTSIRAPFSGIIDEIISEQGTVVSAGMTAIIRIVNLDDMYIKADVPESYLSSIALDNNVEIYLPVLGETINTKVTQVSNYINPDNRTFSITVNIPNKHKNVKPNLTARIKINNYSNANALLIPQSIISENASGEQYIYVVNNKKGNTGVTNRVIIKTGKSQGGLIEVLEGIEDGAEIIQEGARSVKDGQNVTIINNQKND